MPRSAEPSPQHRQRPALRGRGALSSLLRWLWGWARWIGARLLALMVVLVFIFSFINPPTSWTILTETRA